MIADLPQIVQDGESFGATEIMTHRFPRLSQILFVKVQLGRCKVTKYDVLISVGQATLKFELLLCAPENVTLNHLSELNETLMRGLSLDLSGICIPSFDDGLAKGILKVVELSKEARLNEVEEAPQL